MAMTIIERISCQDYPESFECSLCLKYETIKLASIDGNGMYYVKLSNVKVFMKNKEPFHLMVTPFK